MIVRTRDRVSNAKIEFSHLNVKLTELTDGSSGDDKPDTDDRESSNIDGELDLRLLSYEGPPKTQTVDKRAVQHAV